MNKGCLVGLVILALIAGVGYVIWQKIGKDFSTSMVTYQLEEAAAGHVEANPNAQLPADNKGWAALIGGDGSLTDENATLSKMIVEGEFLDFAGKPYIFTVGADKKVRVTGAGPDGIAGTADDINSDAIRKKLDPQSQVPE